MQSRRDTKYKVNSQGCIYGSGSMVWIILNKNKKRTHKFIEIDKRDRIRLKKYWSSKVLGNENIRKNIVFEYDCPSIQKLLLN